MVAEERAKSKEQRGKSGEQRLASLNLFLLSQVSNVKKILFEKIEEDFFEKIEEDFFEKIEEDIFLEDRGS